MNDKCDHESTGLVYVIASNGCKMFFRQCKTCGLLTTSAISHLKLSDIEKDSAELKNENLRDEWQKRQWESNNLNNIFVDISVNGFSKKGYISNSQYWQLNNILEKIESRT